MFSWIIDRPTTYYGFLSGVLISVATTALSTFALAAEAPTNTDRLIRVAIITFVAAAAWFGLGEYVAALRERVLQNQEGIAGTRAEARRVALGVISKESGLRLYAVALVAVSGSVAWPFL